MAEAKKESREVEAMMLVSQNIVAQAEVEARVVMNNYR